MIGVYDVVLNMSVFAGFRLEIERTHSAVFLYWFQHLDGERVVKIEGGAGFFGILVSFSRSTDDSVISFPKIEGFGTAPLRWIQKRKDRGKCSSVLISVYCRFHLGRGLRSSVDGEKAYPAARGFV